MGIISASGTAIKGAEATAEILPQMWESVFEQK